MGGNAAFLSRSLAADLGSAQKVAGEAAAVTRALWQ